MLCGSCLNGSTKHTQIWARDKILTFSHIIKAVAQRQNFLSCAPEKWLFDCLFPDGFYRAGSEQKERATHTCPCPNSAWGRGQQGGSGSSRGWSVRNRGVCDISGRAAQVTAPAVQVAPTVTGTAPSAMTALWAYLALSGE